MESSVLDHEKKEQPVRLLFFALNPVVTLQAARPRQNFGRDSTLTIQGVVRLFGALHLKTQAFNSLIVEVRLAYSVQELIKVHSHSIGSESHDLKF
ncbi:hypothetical protein [Stenotrophomonas bentonitica]|uniref:hypothetical protein n=1 Tax=Stenotrophomonas bentonitica TaxID=1450134 RepID=UPI00345E9FA8